MHLLLLLIFVWSTNNKKIKNGKQVGGRKRGKGRVRFKVLVNKYWGGMKVISIN